MAAGASAAAPAGLAALSSTEPTTVPTLIVSPTAALSDTTPAAGASTGIVALSVSRSKIGSSRSTHCPVFLCATAMVTSVTDSPTLGMLMSMGMGSS